MMKPIWVQKEEELEKRRKACKPNKFFGSLELTWLVGCGFVLYKSIWNMSDALKTRDCGAFDVLYLMILIYGFLLGLAALDILTLDGGKKMERIKRLLGINIMAMKLDALVKHLKLRFKHIPEHYECESTEKAE